MKLVRGALAALIHTLSLPDPLSNYLSTLLQNQQGTSSHHKDSPQQQQQQNQLGPSQHSNSSHIQLDPAILHQCSRLLRLCCLLIGRGDAVVDAAAVRVLALLSDSAQMKLGVDTGV